MDPFLETIFVSSAFRAATGQGKGTHVYRGRLPAEDESSYSEAKQKFRSAFRKIIITECQAYQSTQMTEDNWLDLIRRIQIRLSADHNDILASGTIRLGTVQKMLSLSLKLYWRAGDVSKRPFWPPLDRQVIKAAKKGLESPDRDISWKKLDDQEQYVRMMRAIEKFAIEQKGFVGSSEWEYDIWKTNDEI